MLTAAPDFIAIDGGDGGRGAVPQALADFINTARGFMFSLGCIQALRCHTNTCPTGITTHNERL